MAVRTVTRRGERRLVIDFSFRRPDGSKGRYRHDAEVQTRAAATAEERRRLAALSATGSPFEVADEATRTRVAPAQPKALTFGEVADRYLSEFAPSHLKPSSLYTYESVIRLRLKPFFGKMPLAEVTAKAVRDFDTAMVRDGVSVASRCSTHTTLRSILGKFAVEAELLDRLPRLPPMPKRRSTIPNTMTAEDFRSALAAVRSPSHRLVILLAAHAGLRHGEVRALRCGDVNLATGRLIVRRAMTRDVETTPKSGHDREVPLTRELRAALVDAGVDQRPRQEHVALTNFGEPWADSSIRAAFKAVLARAGIVQWRFHDLRHFFVTALLAARVPAHVVRELAGHADLSTTQRYAHVREKEREAAMGALSAAATGMVPEKPEG